METVRLTERNCHRAATVRPAGSTQAWEWRYNAMKAPTSSAFFGEYVSLVFNPETKEQRIVRNIDRELSDWEAVSWRYEENFEDMYDLARSAFSATSHEPERRALQYIRSYEEMLQSDLASIPGYDRANYVSRFRSWVSTLLAKHSRIMSAAIVGPARFPTARNRKANDAYDTAARDFQSWREHYLRRSAKIIEASKPQEQKDDEEWQLLQKRIITSASIIFRGDTGIEKCFDRALIVSNLYNSIATLSRNGRIEMVRRATDFVRKLGDKFKENGGKPVFTSRHKFWKLLEETEQAIQSAKERTERDDVTIPFPGGEIVKCYSENRLQIYHDQKPSDGTIALFKKEAWRWSRNNGCWQRQLTSAAVFSAAKITPVSVEEINNAGSGL